jgi:anti-sigma factor RsiW
MKADSRERCRELIEQLSRYVDGELTGAARRSMTLHLQRCPCCRSLEESLRHTIEICQKAGRTRPPRDVRARARARIAALLANPPGARARS